MVGYHSASLGQALAAIARDWRGIGVDAPCVYDGSMLAPEVRRDALAQYEALLRAWNARNPHGFAAVFTAEGSAVGFDGSQMNGRDEILSTIRRIFDDHPTPAYVAKVREVRPLGGGAVLVRAVAGLAPTGVPTLNPALNAVQSVVLVPDGETLRIALLQNTPAAFHGHPELATRLTEELTTVLASGQVVAA
jgi:uncharacterized protein (TIGR02246 family)